MGAWCARHNNRYQWLQVDFGRAMRVIKISTQGRQDAAQWVTQYFVKYSQDGSSFAEYDENSNRKVIERSAFCEMLKYSKIYMYFGKLDFTL